ncbi:WD40-repeat-containing domain protein [Xylaria arbuscula]|nr:WD40-repeat-containing domain protein [Xylaria arbuscula]
MKSRQIESYQPTAALRQVKRHSRFHASQHLKASVGYKIYRAALSPDGLQMATASSLYKQTSESTSKMDLWGDNGQGQLQCIQPLANGFLRDVEAIAFSPNSEWIVAIVLSGRLFLWNRFVSFPHDIGASLASHGAIIHEISFSPDCQRFAVHGRYHLEIHIIELDIQWCRAVQTLSWGDCHRSLAFSPSGQLLASGDSSTAANSSRASICIWKKDDIGRFQQFQKIAIATEHGYSTVNTVRFSSDETLICVPSEGGALLFNLNLEGQFQQTQQLIDETHTITSIFCLAEIRHFISVSSYDKNIRVWEFDEEGNPEVIDELIGPSRVLDLSRNGQWLVTGTSVKGESPDRADIIIWKRQVI